MTTSTPNTSTPSSLAPETVSQSPSPAEKWYKAHKKNVANYQKRNGQKMKEAHYRYLENLKLEPQKYEEHLQKRREYYQNVVKPRKLACKSENHT